MFKLNFKISLNCYTDIKRYADSLHLPIQTSFRHLLANQVLCLQNNHDEFDKNYRKCKPKDTEGTINSYGKEKLPKSYSIEVSDFIYTNIQKIKAEYNDKTNTVVNNLLHIGIKDRLSSFKNSESTPHKYLDGATKQYAIPLSNVFTERLSEIAEIEGIKVNQLISLIVGDFIINNYTDYNNNVYMNTATGKYNHGAW